MIITETICKTALSKSNLPGLNYSLNPYRGCEHNCAYCYVPNILRINRKSWGGFVEVRKNMPFILKKELKDKKRGRIGISTVTDPYQPIESKFKLTRYCIEQLLIYDFPICIQTKSDLVIRDIDLISRFSESELIFSIGTLNDNERKFLEPNAASINNRLNALKKYSDKGIYTIVFFGPIYPTIKIEDLEKIIDVFYENGTKEIIVDKFNLKPGILEVLKKKFPNNIDLIKDNIYFKKILEETIKLCKKKKIKAAPAF
jgi:DNA repair photolyase